MGSNALTSVERRVFGGRLRSGIRAAVAVIAVSMLAVTGVTTANAAEADTGSNEAEWQVLENGENGTSSVNGDSTGNEGGGGSTSGAANAGSDGIAPGTTPTEQQEQPEAPAETGDQQGEGEQGQVPVAPQQAPIAPLSVPSATGTNAVITVKVGADRSGSSETKLQGVTLKLYNGGSGGPTTPVTDAWATCVSDAQGDCSFTVPQTQPTVYGQCISWFIVCLEREVLAPQGANYNKRFWVVAESAPTGWYLNPALEIGSGTGTNTSYAFRAPKVRATNTYRSGADFMSSNEGGSTGVWAPSRTNPKLQLTCQSGLKVALILDLSGSVGNAGALGDLKNAAKGMADALKGTGSSVALYTFAENAPRSNGVSGRNYASVNLDTGTNLQTLKNNIDQYQTGGGTNWDAGIYQVAQSQERYDIAIVVTDGMPTFRMSGSNVVGDGDSASFADVERATLSANALKAKGTRVVAVGVGTGVSGSVDNLRALSGVNAYAPGAGANDVDYFQAGWGKLADLLEGVALGATCQATVEIEKLTQGYGATSPSNGGAGWQFASVATGASSQAPTGNQTTGASGKVSYTYGFTSPTGSANVTLTEIMSQSQQGEGWKLDAVSCSINDGAPVTQAAKKADLVVSPGDQVHCTFTNVQTLEPGIEVVKEAWDAADPLMLEGATKIADGGQVRSGKTISWSYTVTNTGQTMLNEVTVTDDQLAAGAVSCPKTMLTPGESMVCVASGPVTATN